MENIYNTLPLKNIQPRLKGIHLTPFVEYLNHSTLSDWWYEETLSEKVINTLELPVLNVTGWYDTLSKATVNGYVTMRYSQLPAKIKQQQYLMIGPWDHGGYNVTSPHEQYQFKNGAEAEMYQLQMLQNWFAVHLKGEDPTILNKPVQLFIMGTGEWEFFDSWPIPEAEERRLYLNSQGSANTLSGNGSLKWSVESYEHEKDSFTYDPADPIRVLTERLGELMTQGDWREIEKREDVLVYSTPTLKEGIKVVGPAKVILYASSDARDTDWVARLVDVYPDGFAKEISYGVLRARYRESFTEPELIEPGRIYEYDIQLDPIGNLFKAGHKIRLEISSSCFPIIDRNTNTGHPLGEDGPEDLIKANQQIYHDKSRPSHVLLPVLKD